VRVPQTLTYAQHRAPARFYWRKQSRLWRESATACFKIDKCLAAILSRGRNSLWQRWLQRDYKFIHKVTHKNCAQPEFPFGNRVMQPFPDKTLQIARVASRADFFSAGGE
jgi:hypothetical protein